MRFHPADREVERESRKREGNKKGRPVHSRRKLVKLEYHPLLQTLPLPNIRRQGVRLFLFRLIATPW